MMLSPDHQHFMPAGDGDQECPRLNLLLSYGGWRDQSFADLLPQLLSPLGIRSIRVETGEEAEDIIRKIVVHIAVVDLAIPLKRASASSTSSACVNTSGGAKTLQLLRRLEHVPPTIVIRPPEPSVRESARSLVQSLREGAFAVLDRPVNIEDMLDVMRRVLRRHYEDGWPQTSH